MAPSFDYAMSSLYCLEESSSIFEDDVDDNYSVLDDEFDDFNSNQIVNQSEKFIGFSGFLLQNDELFLCSLFDNEKYHFLGVDYLIRLRTGDLDLGSRNDAVNWIEKVQSHYNFGPLCFYLSVNYLDRFLSKYELPPGKSWMMQLLAVACLSIAAKIDENDVPFSLDLQVCDAKFIFEAKTIQRMELLVMSTLNWRMQSVTPFSFIDYFLCKLSHDRVPPPSLIFRAIQLITSTIKGIELLEFKPSEIAAAVTISVIQETQTVEQQNPDNAFSSLFPQQLEKGKVMKCVEKIQDIRLNRNDNNNNVGVGVSSSSSTTTTTSTSFVPPQSPIGVLDATTCMSYKSDDTSSSIDPTSSSPSYANFKRRKLDHNHNNNNNNNNNKSFKLDIN